MYYEQFRIFQNLSDIYPCPFPISFLECSWRIQTRNAHLDLVCATMQPWGRLFASTHTIDTCPRQPTFSFLMSNSVTSFIFIFLLECDNLVSGIKLDSGISVAAWQTRILLVPVKFLLHNPSTSSDYSLQNDTDYVIVDGGWKVERKQKVEAE